MGLGRFWHGDGLGAIKGLEVGVVRILSCCTVEVLLFPADAGEAVEEFLCLFSELLALHLNYLFWNGRAGLSYNWILILYF